MNPKPPSETIIFEGVQPGSLQQASLNTVMTEIGMLARRWHNLQDRTAYKTQGSYVYQELKRRHPSVHPEFVKDVYKEWRRKNPKTKTTSSISVKQPPKKGPPGGPSGGLGQFYMSIR